MTNAATTQKSPRIQIAMTETITRTYFLTEEQLAENSLPTTVEALDELAEEDGDTLGVTLLDELAVETYDVTDRTFEITTEPALSPSTLPGE
jgi:hypothetical protein